MLFIAEYAMDYLFNGNSRVNDSEIIKVLKEIADELLIPAQASNLILASKIAHKIKLEKPIYKGLW